MVSRTGKGRCRKGSGLLGKKGFAFCEGERESLCRAAETKVNVSAGYGRKKEGGIIS